MACVLGVLLLSCYNFDFTCLGVYPEPYLIILKFNKMYAVDILTEDFHVDIIHGFRDSFYHICCNHYDIEIDVSEDMIYYIELGDIKRSNLDMTDVEIFEENACAHDMTVDWIGRRIFYVKSNNIIQQISLNSKNSSVMRFTPGLKFNMITFDPIKGYVHIENFSIKFLKVNFRIYFDVKNIIYFERLVIFLTMLLCLFSFMLFKMLQIVNC